MMNKSSVRPKGVDINKSIKEAWELATTSNKKRALVFMAIIAVVCLVFAMVALCSSNEESGGSGETTIILRIGDPEMTVNGMPQEIDPGRGTAPVVMSDRTLVPIRAIIESVGGTAEWDGESQTATVNYGGNAIRLVINSTTAYFNNEERELDAAPMVINDRTMLPIRFISEELGFAVDWDQDTLTVTIHTGVAEETSAPIVTESPSATELPDNAALPTVYMTTEITPEALVGIYERLGFNAEGNVAVKMSTGEPPNSNYLRPELIADLVRSVDGTIVECNTAYGGSRSNTAMHYQVAEDHGFTAIADVDIMDENGSMEIPIENGTTIHENFVGANLANYDSLISLAHFKGHAMAGFGGAIKNMSIGIASSEGKNWIHTGGNSMTSFMGGDQDAFCEAMAEATSGVVDYLDGQVVYINVMNNISIDCDCDGNPAEPDMHDVGILASYDPVALDQACIDIVYNTDRSESGTLIDRIESRNGLHTLEHAEAIGLGSRAYDLVSIDA